MTPPAKRLPESAAQFPSIGYFRDQVELRLELAARHQGKPMPTFKLDEVQVLSDPGDASRYHLVYRNAGLNLGLEGMVLTDRHELSLWKYPLHEPQVRTPVAYLEMEDACSVTKTLLGNDGIKGNCQDSVVEPKVVATAKHSSTLQAFDQYCREAYQSYLAKNSGVRRAGGFDLKRTQILNPESGNFGFDLLYENPANAFYCRGHVATTGLQTFLMASGSRQEYAAAPEAQYVEGTFTKQPQVHEMNDACRLTAALVGAKEFHGDCREWSEGERNGTKAVGYLGTGLEYAALGIVGYDVAGLGAKGIDLLFKTNLHAASFGKWGSPAAWLSRKTWAGLRWPFVHGVRLGATALSSAKAGLAAWNVTAVSAAGAGSIGLAVTVGFAGGFLLGAGLEKAQQKIFGNSLSGLAGDWAFRKLGPADQSTIDWFDKWFGWLP
jgi:hypothetical protein